MKAERKLELIVKEIEEALKHNYEVRARAVEKDNEYMYNYTNGVINCLKGLQYFIEDLDE